MLTIIEPAVQRLYSLYMAHSYHVLIHILCKTQLHLGFHLKIVCYSLYWSKAM